MERITIEEMYPKLLKIAHRLASTGLPKTLSAHDLAQVAAIAYWQGRATSMRDCKKTMTDHIRSERLHGTAMTEGTKGNRSRSKRIRRKHMAVQLDMMAARDERVESGVISRDLLKRLPQKVGEAALYVHILGFTEVEAARILQISRPTLCRRLSHLRPAA